MVNMFQALGIKSQIQQEAIYLLSGSAGNFMRADLFRERLIKALAREGSSTVFLSRINAEIETLVCHQLLVRRIKRGEREIGLNKIIWRVAPETISSIREATTFVRLGNLFHPDNFGDVTEQVKIQLRIMKASYRRVSHAAFEILVSRFSALTFN